MQKLNLPEFHLRGEERKGRAYIFDEFRRRWVAMTPEEWVRQHFLHYLAVYKGFPRSLMAVEKKVDVNGLSQRFDLLVYDRKGQPLLVGEFKAPSVVVSQQAFDQAVRYNSSLGARYVVVSNGLAHYICRMDFNAGKAEYLGDIPTYNEL
jgi:predicted type IV restriction endonuclease